MPTIDNPLHELGAAAREYLANGPAFSWVPVSRMERLAAIGCDVIPLLGLVCVVEMTGVAVLVGLVGVGDRYGWPAMMALWVLSVIAYTAREVAGGRTFGKGRVGACVCVLSDGPVRRRRAARWALRSAPLFVILAGLVGDGVRELVAPQPPYKDPPGAWVPLAMVVTLGLTIASALVSFGPLRQSWYDLLAGTAVMRRGLPPARRGFEPIFPGT